MMDHPSLNVQLTPWLDPPPAAGQDVLRLDYASPHDGRADWGVLIPGRQESDLAVVLHGHGSHGDQLLIRPDIRDLWLPAMRAAGLGILCPNLRDNAWMAPPAVADLHALILWLRARFNPARLFLFGGSMGGTSALIYATHHPELLSGVMALCPAADLPSYWHWAKARSDQSPTLDQITAAIEDGYRATPEHSSELFALHTALTQKDRLTMPLALAHGSADAVIPVEPTRRLAHAMKPRLDANYIEMEGGDHDAPLAIFPRLLDWILRWR